MTRKSRPPSKKPSKAYLVSFGDTMTALLAFFIVLNSFAKDQTGAKLHAGTGSFLEALKRTGAEGNNFGTRSDQNIKRVTQAPIYAVPEKWPKNPHKRSGPDEQDDQQRIINRQAEEFQRFLNQINERFGISTGDPTASQVVFDSFEKLGNTPKTVLGPNAIQLASDVIGQLSEVSFEVEVIVWATMPSQLALRNANQSAHLIEQFIENSFRFSGEQRKRFSVSAQPWLFVDATRPKLSFVLSRMDR
jgi:hypothetical protein